MCESFTKLEPALLFLHCFFQTLAREWNRLDQYRMDKFMMLARKVLKTGMLIAMRSKVEYSLEQFSVGVILPVLQSKPDGLRSHLCFVFWDEVDGLEGEQVEAFLAPFLYVLGSPPADSKSFYERALLKNVFQVDTAKLVELNVDIATLSACVFDMAASQEGELTPTQRSAMYALSRRLKAAIPGGRKLKKRGAVAQVEQDPEVETRKKKKAKVVEFEEEEDLAVMEEVDDVVEKDQVVEVPSKKKSKKNKKNKKQPLPPLDEDEDAYFWWEKDYDNAPGSMKKKNVRFSLKLNKELPFKKSIKMLKTPRKSSANIPAPVSKALSTEKVPLLSPEKQERLRKSVEEQRQYLPDSIPNYDEMMYSGVDDIDMEEFKAQLSQDDMDWNDFMNDARGLLRGRGPSPVFACEEEEEEEEVQEEEGQEIV